MRRGMAVLALLLLGLAPADSQALLQQYAATIDAVVAPKASIYSYTVSQAGPSDIEQRHRIYRSGAQVRDETLIVDGASPKAAMIRVYRNTDAYAIGRTAPRQTEYRFLFLRPVSHGDHIDYLYQTTPMIASAFSVTQVLIDGTSFLPRTIWFKTASASASGKGVLQYAAFGGHWMPVLATVDAIVGGKPARERIAWGDYRFPASLPAATFNARRRPLPPS
jgi:hypothetical protein